MWCGKAPVTLTGVCRSSVHSGDGRMSPTPLVRYLLSSSDHGVSDYVGSVLSLDPFVPYRFPTEWRDRKSWTSFTTPLFGGQTSSSRGQRRSVPGRLWSSNTLRPRLSSKASTPSPTCDFLGKTRHCIGRQEKPHRSSAMYWWGEDRSGVLVGSRVDRCFRQRSRGRPGTSLGSFEDK